MRVLFFIFCLLLPTTAWSQTPGRPSFDCAKAGAPDEKAICADPKLAELDRDEALAHGRLDKDSADGVRQTAEDDLADRHACGDDRLCILNVQLNTIDDFNGWISSKVPMPEWAGAYRLQLFEASGKPATSGIPTKVGTCTRARITGIAGRLEGKLAPGGSGTSVKFADGLLLVSYEYLPDVAKSRLGDEALVCLTALPKRCPAGDDRGKVYAATNLRTKGSWVLPDSEHMCGGA